MDSINIFTSEKFELTERLIYILIEVNVHKTENSTSREEGLSSAELLNFNEFFPLLKFS